MFNNSAERDLQLVLPSNVNVDLFKDNAANNYKTRLAAPLCLDGDWEVALLDAQFSRHWPNVARDCVLGLIFEPETTGHAMKVKAYLAKTVIHSFDATLADLIPVLSDSKGPVAFGKQNSMCGASIEVPKGYYPADNTKDFVNSIASAFKQQTDSMFEAAGMNVQLQYDESNYKAMFNMSGGRFLIVTPNTYLMGALLGFEPLKELKHDGTTYFLYGLPKRGKRRPAGHQYRTMFVYSDFVRFVRVGDVQAPLLGVVSIPNGTYGDQVHWAAPIAHYTQVSKSYIDTLQIQLNTDEGELFPFEKDANVRVICRLHLRRRSPFMGI